MLASLCYFITCTLNHTLFVGGWLLVSNVVIDSPSPRKFSVESSYREIGNCHNNKALFLAQNAMKDLRKHLSFTQLRFRCSKQQGRMFHVITASNSSGEAAVQYFSGQTDVRPFGCGSFATMEDDNSSLARVCNQWKEKKWGSKNQDENNRLYAYVAWVPWLYHWLLTADGSRWECDDFNRHSRVFYGLSSGDFWKVFVR